MQKAKLFVMISVVLFLGWMTFFQGTQPASSHPLFGFTLTPAPSNTPVVPTNTPVPPTNTPVVPTSPVVNTLPPPPQQTPFIIPVTGTDRSGNMEGMINVGLVLVAFGLIAAGLKSYKK
jgi:hypothetical protein